MTSQKRIQIPFEEKGQLTDGAGLSIVQIAILAMAIILVIIALIIERLKI